MARRPSTRKNIQIEALEGRQLLAGGAAPTAQAQYMLELINTLRTDPSRAADLLTQNLSGSTRATLAYYHVDLNQAKQDIATKAPRQPLAWNDSLASAAQTQSQDMATNGFQSHTGSDGSTPDQRIQRAGYTPARKVGENAFAYAQSIDQAMQSFALDWGVPDKGHLNNLTEPGAAPSDTFKEVGIGTVDSTKPGFGKVVTVDLGLKQNAPSQLVGVVYNDSDHNNFYSVGEGVAGAEIDVTNDQGQLVGSAWSAGPGGYQIPLAPGHYHVQAKYAGHVSSEQNITVGDQNVKLDFTNTDAWSVPAPSTPPAASSRPAAEVIAAPQVVKQQPQTQPVVSSTPAPAPEQTPVKVETRDSTSQSNASTQSDAASTGAKGAVFSMFNNSMFPIYWNQVWSSVPTKSVSNS
ncbi:MAG TPA: CAP domain-containing protein [Isosphaeraceae bacterium]|nr:CAP domain-containing protein [Isosphaeraceae bacterium]